MDATARRLEVEIIGDTKGLNRALKKAEGDLSAFGSRIDRNVKNMRGLAIGSGAAFAGGLVASEGLAQVKAAVNAASDLNEQVSKSTVVFGQASKDILSWSDTTSKAYGISKTAALEAAGTFGNITRSMGLSESAAADMSKNLVNLAGDLASFNNVATDDALLALRSAITGEYEPLRRLGSALSEARVQQEALAETGKKSASQLTNQEKVTARYNLILKDTALAQGDAARTSDSFANQQRQLAAAAADLQAKLGNMLLPVMTDLVESLNDATSGANTLFTALGKLKDLKIGPIEVPFNFSFNAPGSSGGGFGSGIADFFAQPGTTLGATKSVVDFYRSLLDLAKSDPQAAKTLFSSFSNLSMPGLPGGPGAGGPVSPSPVLPKFGGPGGSGMDVLQTQLPIGVLNSMGMNRATGNQAGLLKDLIAAKQWLNQQLGMATDQQDRADLISALQGVTGEIQSIYREKASAAEKATRELKDLSLDKTDGYMQAVNDWFKSVEEAARDMADKFKQAALDRLDRKQKNLDTSRAIEDARKQLTFARRLGGEIGIQMASRDLQDAQIARQRYLLEGSTVTKGANGFNVSGGIHLYGITNVNQLIAELQKRAKAGAGSSRGLAPGGLYGLPH